MIIRAWFKPVLRQEIRLAARRQVPVWRIFGNSSQIRRVRPEESAPMPL